MNFLKLNTGQSSLEVLIALTIMVLAISAAIVVGFGNQAAVVDTELHNRALYIARQELEELRADARQDFGLVASSTGQEGSFTKQVTVTQLGTYSKEVKVTITWQLSPTQLRDLELATIITDWRTAWDQSGTGDGGTGLTGDWLNPETAGTLDLGPGNEGTDIAIRESTVFITGEAADTKKHDIFSINVTNINSPQLISSIDTGPGIQSIAIWNEYAYVANRATNEQLQVLNISNPASMQVVATSSLSNNTQLPLTVFAKDGYAYVGTDLSSSGGEIQIFDVSTPSNPSFETSIEVGADVNDLYVIRDRLYAATSKVDKELIIYEVSDPNDPIEIASFNKASSQGNSVFATNYTNAYMGLSTYFHPLNTSNLSSVTSVSAFSASGNIEDVYVRDYLAFVATDHSNAEFKVINITNSANPILQSQFNFPQVATGITYKDNVVYVSVRSNEALRIITSSQ